MVSSWWWVNGGWTAVGGEGCAGENNRDGGYCDKNGKYCSYWSGWNYAKNEKGNDFDPLKDESLIASSAAISSELLKNL